MYDVVYPTFPARLRHSDAVFHPVSFLYLQPLQILTSSKTISSLGVFRNHLASAAIAAVQRHLTSVFHKRKLDTVNARAEYVAQLFKSDKEHPIIWREYVEGNIPNHPEVSGYKTVDLFPYCPCSLLMFYPDKVRSFSIRTHPGNNPKLLFFIWNYGATW